MKTTKRYIVSLGYYHYVFKNRIDALNFAETAFDTQQDEKSVTIEIKDEEVEE